MMTTTMVLDVCMPARCWIAEMRRRHYVLPVTADLELARVVPESLRRGAPTAAPESQSASAYDHAGSFALPTPATGHPQWSPPVKLRPGRRGDHRFTRSWRRSPPQPAR